MPRVTFSIILFMIVTIIQIPVSAAQTPLSEALDELEWNGRTYLEKITESHPQARNIDGARKLIENAMVLGDAKAAAAQVLVEQAVVLGLRDYDTLMLLGHYADEATNHEEAAGAFRLAYDQARDDQQRARTLLNLSGVLVELESYDHAYVTARAAQDLNDSPEAMAAVTRAESLLNFEPESLNVEERDATPRACLDFRYALSDDVIGNRINDFIQIEPRPAQLSVVATGAHSVCLSGLAYRSEYILTILPGMPFRMGAKLTAAASYMVKTADREEALGFTRGRYVLPKLDKAGIPLRSVNYDAADLQIYRVPERELAGLLRSGQFARRLYGYELSEIKYNLSDPVWTGQVAIERNQNQEAITSIDLSSFLTKTEPGVYVLAAFGRQAGDTRGDYYSPDASQWFIVTDLGLSTYNGSDGLTVSVRSLEQATPKANVTVQLLAANNEILFEDKTGLDGLARFDPGLMKGRDGRRPLALTAWTAQGDFSFISLESGTFDLSDRGVAGNRAQSPQDLYLYTDRDIYRRGETIHLNGLLRSANADGIGKTPLLFTVRRPDGEEFRTDNLIGNEAGGYAMSIDLPENAYTGTWQIEAAFNKDQATLASIYVQVEDIVPPTIEVDLATAAPRLMPGQKAQIEVAANYLYGAPAGGLPVQASLNIAKDPEPFEGFSGYVFGPVDEDFRQRVIPLSANTLDNKGKANLTVEIPATIESQVPIAASMQASVLEFSGRAVNERLSIKINNRDLWLGIKPVNEGWIGKDDPAKFHIVALNGDGAPVEKSLSYRIVREEYVYHWYYLSSQDWSYEVSRADAGTVAAGDIAYAGAEPASLSQNLDEGQYRLEVFDETETNVTSYRFSVGWYSANQNPDTPDQLQITRDKETYAIGEKASLNIRAPFAGKAQVLIATDRILSVEEIDLPKTGANLPITIRKEWGPGAYVLVSAYRPADAAARHGPSRAIGVAWLGVDPETKRLDVRLDLPERAAPRQRLEIPITVEGQGKETAYVTLAAVDEGVLQISDFASPDPLRYFFEQRRLGVEIRDLYGQLIAAFDGKPGRLTQGGDADAAFAGAPSDFKIVALHSGLIKLDKNGQGRVTLDIPDYNGRLRLMAVVYSKSKMGSVERGLIVNDPTLVLVSTARFLAPGDESVLIAQIQNVSGPEGEYQIAIDSQGPVEVSKAASLKVSLKQGESQRLSVPIKASSVGKVALSVTLTGPQNYMIKTERTLTVRPASPPTVVQSLTRLEPGTAQDIAIADPASLPGSTRLYASLADQPPLDIAGVLAALDRYPYGCIEQTVSRALPLLYADSLETPSAVDVNYAQGVQRALTRASLMQRYDGSFGLWASGGSEEMWLSAYATDFLWQARQAGFVVQDQKIEKGFNYLNALVRRSPDRKPTPELFAAKSYGFYVLARANTLDLGVLRQFFDAYAGIDDTTKAPNYPLPLALTQLGAAFDLYGDTERRDRAINAALIALDRYERPVDWHFYWHDYGSRLRDLAGMIHILSQVKGHEETVNTLALQLGQYDVDTRWMTTQEQAAFVLAAHALLKERNNSSPISVTVDDQPQAAKQGQIQLQFSDAWGQKTTNHRLRNEGADVVWLRTTRVHVPLAAQPDEHKGISYNRVFYRPDGTPADLAQIKQGDILIAVVEGRKIHPSSGDFLLADLLPAGFELINRRIARDQETGEFEWTPESTDAKFIQYLDDRFVAAFWLGENGRDYTFVYAVRAVTPGRYALPHGQVEDMYQSRTYARADGGLVTISAQ